MIKQIFFESIIVGLIASGVMVVINKKITNSWHFLSTLLFVNQVLGAMVPYFLIRSYFQYRFEWNIFDQMLFTILSIGTSSYFFYYETKIKIISKK